MYTKSVFKINDNIIFTDKNDLVCAHLGNLSAWNNEKSPISLLDTPNNNQYSKEISSVFITF